MKSLLTALLMTLALLPLGSGLSHAQDGAIVFGGTGRTGAMIVQELLDRGEFVTVFARPTSSLDRLDGKTVDMAYGDAMNADDVDIAISTARPRIVINTIGGRGDQMGFWDTTQMAMTASAKKNGAEWVIFLSSVGTGDSAVAYSEAARARTKDSMDERFRAEEDLKASGLNYVIIRTGIIAPEGTAATGNARLTEDRMSLKPVSRADLAKLTVDCIDNAACLNKTFAAEDDTIELRR